MSIDILGRIPPQNIEAEQSILGSILLDKDIIPEVILVIKTDDFYKENHKEIYEAILDIYEKSNPIDLITVSEQLNIRGTLDDIGGLEYLVHLSEIVPTTSNIKYYIKIVQEKSIRRKLIKQSNEVINKAYEDEYENIIDLKSDSLQLLSDINIQGKGKSKTNREILNNIKDRILKERTGEKDKGFFTDILDYDKWTAGLHKQELTIMAGRPASGKTSLGMQIGINVAKKGKHVLFITREMSEEQVATRTIAHKGKINSHKLRSPELLTNDDLIIMDRIIELIAELPFEINEHIDNVQEIRSYCRELKNKGKLDLLIVDYLQLLTTMKKVGNRTEEVGDVSRQLKIMSKEFDIPVIVLAQLSRSVERENRRPKLSDLRECGNIEQDADNVVFIHTPDNVDILAEIQPREIIIAKQRNGATGLFESLYEGKTFTFLNMKKETTSRLTRNEEL